MQITLTEEEIKQKTLESFQKALKSITSLSDQAESWVRALLLQTLVTKSIRIALVSSPIGIEDYFVLSKSS